MAWYTWPGIHGLVYMAWYTSGLVHYWAGTPHGHATLTHTSSRWVTAALCIIERCGRGEALPHRHHVDDIPNNNINNIYY